MLSADEGRISGICLFGMLFITILNSFWRAYIQSAHSLMFVAILSWYFSRELLWLYLSKVFMKSNISFMSSISGLCLSAIFLISVFSFSMSDFWSNDFFTPRPKATGTGPILMYLLLRYANHLYLYTESPRQNISPSKSLIRDKMGFHNIAEISTAHI